MIIILDNTTELKSNSVLLLVTLARFLKKIPIVTFYKKKSFWRTYKQILSHEGICTASTPFVLLGDVLDCLPLDQCDKIFTFVEKNVTTWKSVSIMEFIKFLNFIFVVN